MRLRPWAKIGALLLVSSWCGSAHAATDPVEGDPSPGPWLVVERSKEAESCPSESALLGQTESLLGTRRPLFVVHVRFERRDGTFFAEIRRANQEGVRKLSDTHSDCAPLASAVATALALLVEADEAPSLPEPAPVAEEEPPSPPLPQPILPPRTFVGVQAALGGSFLIVDGVHFLGEGRLFVEHGRLHVALGGLALLPASTSFDPGSLEHSILSLSARGCARLVGGVPLFLSACSGIVGGSLKVEASGYSNNETSRTPWFAIPLEAQIGGRWSEKAGLSPGWRVGATALIPTRQETFVVEGLGEALSTSKVGVTLWAALELSFGFSRSPR